MGEGQAAKSLMHMVCSLQCSGFESLKLHVLRSGIKTHYNIILFEFQANATLAFLEKITEEDKVARCFSRSPLSLRAAAAVGFLVFGFYLCDEWGLAYGT